MAGLGLETGIVDAAVLERSVTLCREQGVLLPTFAQLTNPMSIPEKIRNALAGVDPTSPHPLNLFRVHWHNTLNGRDFGTVPEYVVLTEPLTGIRAPIAVALGSPFPMIRSHKVLAAYGCLAPRVVTGGFDPAQHRALWPSTGNYCRGGVAISRIMGCRGVAILPEGMSQERFHWLEKWVTEPTDIIRTPGSESNVKEIYDACAELSRDPDNHVFNQFCEFGNHLIHRRATGAALSAIADSLGEQNQGLTPTLFVSASGSAGTLGAGNHLKERYGLKIAAVEALECPTLLRNGFGEHNIQGIGDKHVPLIHDVMNTDLVIAISDRSTDRLGVLFNSKVGREYLGTRRDVPAAMLQSLGALGFSSIANVLAAIKAARYLDLGPQDLILTVATDDASMYGSEIELIGSRDFPDGFDALHAAETFGAHVSGMGTDDLLDLTHLDQERIFNLGYFTWVEQQGVALEDFKARKHRSFWKGLDELPEAWDEAITEFNGRTGILKSF